MLKNWVSSTSAVTEKCSFKIGAEIPNLLSYKSDKWHQCDLSIKEIISLLGKVLSNRNIGSRRLQHVGSKSSIRWCSDFNAAVIDKIRNHLDWQPRFLDHVDLLYGKISLGLNYYITEGCGGRGGKAPYTDWFSFKCWPLYHRRNRNRYPLDRKQAGMKKHCYVQAGRKVP